MLLPPLRTLLVALWVACIGGAVVIAALTLGWIGWAPFVLGAALGVIVGVPAGIWNARYIKRKDPDWPPRRA